MMAATLAHDSLVKTLMRVEVLQPHVVSMVLEKVRHRSMWRVELARH